MSAVAATVEATRVESAVLRPKMRRKRSIARFATIDTPSAAQGAIRRRQFSCRAVILGTRATNMAQAGQAPATSRHANLRATGCCHITLLRRCHRWSHRNPILASMVGHNERRRRDRTCSCACRRPCRPIVGLAFGLSGTSLVGIQIRYTVLGTLEAIGEIRIRMGSPARA